MNTNNDLSSDAKAVLDAFNEFHEFVNRRIKIAASLRALAKQSTFADTAVNITDEVVLVNQILAIAAELEGPTEKPMIHTL